MKLRALSTGFVLALVLGIPLWIASCSKSQPPKEAPPAESQQTTPPAEPRHDQHVEQGEASEHHEAGEEGHGGAAETVTPGATSSEIWVQIAGEQSKLETAIQSGQLSDVHHLAFGIRDLAAGLTGKTGNLGAADAAKIQQTMDQIRQSASKLDEYGDSGNLSGVKQEYTRFQQELQTLKTLTRGA